jgi:protein phosphatase
MPPVAQVALNIRAATNAGMVRPENEDAWAVYPPEPWTERWPPPLWRIAGVADGMGGHRGGAVASSLAVRGFIEYVAWRLAAPPPVTHEEWAEILDEAVREAERRIQVAALQDRTLEEMGSTLTVGVFFSDLLYIAHVGDSRAYLHRGGKLRQLTHDHTYGQYLVHRGELSAAELADHPMRGRLTRFLGPDGHAGPELMVTQLWGGDRLLFCTDGLAGYFDEHEIRMALERGEPAAAGDLVEEANRRGGRDNITVVLADCRGPTAASGSDEIPVYYFPDRSTTEI